VTDTLWVGVGTLVACVVLCLWLWLWMRKTD